MEPKTKVMQRLAKRAARLKNKVGRFRARYLRLARNPFFLFIVGHMRSGSSLLTHILNSNPDIIGFGENHLSYWKPKHLDRCIANTLQHLGRKEITERYVLDKILHGSHKISPTFLKSEQFRLIFLIREPRGTLASMLRLSRERPKFLWNDYERASRYYIKRLHQISGLAALERFHERAIYLTHEQLIDRSAKVFAGVEGFLDLQTPLSEEYELMPTTGRPGVGDPTHRIKAGRIVRAPHAYTDVEAPPAELLEECEYTFRATLKVLKTHCRPAADWPGRSHQTPQAA